MYSKKVMQHFKKPKNYGEMKNADAIGEVGNPSCGDVMKIYLKIDDKGKNKDKPKIKDIKFQTLGCIAAIATSSMVTELAKGKTLEEAKKLTNKNVSDSLGSLPPIKMHCSNLAADALHKAVENWEKRK
jgi:nitrogen fixation NifU-like protein